MYIYTYHYGVVFGSLQDGKVSIGSASSRAEDTPVEPSEPIKLDLDDENNSDGSDYAAFKDIDDIEAIRVEDKGDFVLD